MFTLEPSSDGWRSEPSRKQSSAGPESRARVSDAAPSFKTSVAAAAAAPPSVRASDAATRGASAVSTRAARTSTSLRSRSRSSSDAVAPQDRGCSSIGIRGPHKRGARPPPCPAAGALSLAPPALAQGVTVLVLATKSDSEAVSPPLPPY